MTVHIIAVRIETEPQVNEVQPFQNKRCLWSALKVHKCRLCKYFFKHLKIGLIFKRILVIKNYAFAENLIHSVCAFFKFELEWTTK